MSTSDTALGAERVDRAESAVETPESEEALAELLREASRTKRRFEIRGGGTRRGLGQAVDADAVLSLRGLEGITLYDPGSLTLIARAGTPLSVIERALDENRQRLPFEPMDHRGLYGTDGEPTLGGVVATNQSGPRRIRAGACRDSVIGVRFLDGRGALISNGGRTMKNVTGLDLVKLLCGSHGTLGVLVEIVIKVLPRAEREVSLVLDGQTVDEAVTTMSRALGTPLEISGAAHRADEGLTLLRIEGWEAQVEYRLRSLRERLAADARVLGGDEHRQAWREIRDVAPFHGRDGAVWRFSLRGDLAPRLAADLRETFDAEVLVDWGGAQLWALLPPERAGHDPRPLLDAIEGHATLVRVAPGTDGDPLPVFPPLHPRLASISAGLRGKFDPDGILNPGRMG